MEETAAIGQPQWLRIAEGVVSIVFGLAAVFWPAITVAVLALLFEIFVIVIGLVYLYRGFRAMGARHRWWPQMLIGALSLLIGLGIFGYQGITTVLLLYFIAAWALVVGVMEVIAGVTGGGILVAITGVISILFGFVLLGNPLAGAVALVFVIGIFAIVRGVLSLVGALRLPEGMSAEEG